MTENDPESPFYVGYADAIPTETRAFLRPRMVAVFAFAILLVAAVAASQRPFEPSVYEFGVVREFSGWISTKPTPALIALRPGNTAHCGAVSTFPLVQPGKFGALDLVEPLEGKHVKLKGTLVHREGSAMIEVVPDSVFDSQLGQTPHVSQNESLGMQRLEGEIVDSKCFYGVMNPATGKTHKACAARCISGGIPPSFLAKGSEGREAVLLLIDEHGRSHGRDILEYVGEPIAMMGEIVVHDDLLLYRASLDSLERLAP